MDESDFWISKRKHELRPSTLYKPKISMDGNQWCALFGSNLVDGVAGFGDTPAKAFEAFDNEWNNRKLPTTKRGYRGGKTRLTPGCADTGE